MVSFLPIVSYLLCVDNRIALLKMDKKFLTGYLALADGEKDPRNLMVAFAIARVILIEFDITDHVEVPFHPLLCFTLAKVISRPYST